MLLSLQRNVFLSLDINTKNVILKNIDNYNIDNYNLNEINRKIIFNRIDKYYLKKKIDNNIKILNKYEIMKKVLEIL